MKRFILTALMVSGLAGAIAQNVQAQQDTTEKTQQDTTEKKRYKFSVQFGDDERPSRRSSRDTIRHQDETKGRFMGGITLTRIDLGFSKLIDDGSFSLSPTNDFLDYKPGKTSTVSFDVLQFGYRFNQNFKVYLAGGFDWTLIRLKKDITLQNEPQDLTYINEDIHFEKNRFSSSYVHIPLNFELRTKENDNGKRFYFVFGPEVGFLLNGKIKQISDERGKQKVKDDYHFQPFRYGGTARLGYGSFGVFAKYYMNDMFDSPAQKNLRNMSFGVTLGLN
jgi:hypothetical protein